MAHIAPALSMMPDARWSHAALPLLDAGRVDALEWTVDFGFHAPPPPWCHALLDHFSSAGALWGHATGYSALSVGGQPARKAWLARCQKEFTSRTYQGLSDHGGFSQSDAFSFGAPLPVPQVPAMRDLGVRGLRQLQRAARVQVGMENVALSFHRSDALGHGAFLGDMLRAVDGYLLLDLHNLHCAAVNFRLPVKELLAHQPLDRVQVIHVSGGRNATHARRTLRRDTHDGGVPAAVFRLLERVLPHCPQLRAVVLEQLPQALQTTAQQRRFQRDFHRVCATLGVP